MSKVYRVGAISPKLGRLEWLYCNDEWPVGRFTTDEQQAMVWANEAATMFNSDPKSGCTEWTPTVWLDDFPSWITSDSDIEQQP
jgi:TPR repeat protein